MTHTASFTYRSLSGTPLYQVERFEDAQGPKSFRQRRADGNGNWIDGKGIMNELGRVLYRWPELVGHESVYIVEGEKCADALWALDIPATTSTGGAGKWNTGPFHEERSYAEQLILAKVGNIVVLPDNDDPGRRHAHDVAAACHGAGLGVKMVDLPGLPPKGDIVDFLRDHAKDDLVAQVAATADWTPGTVSSQTAAEGAAMMDDIVGFIKRYVALTDYQADELALFVVHTHAFEAAETTPYQNIGSATKQSGKTRLLEVLELLVDEPWLTGRATTAVLARRIEDKRPTLLLDETDAAFKAESDYAEALRAILNSGYRHSGKASVCVGGGSSYIDLSTFCPKAIAGIGKLPDTVADRSVPIWLQRRSASERVERLRARDAQKQAEPLRGAVACWATANLDHLRALQPTIPPSLSDRAADVCEPLLAIAETISGEWPERARRAVVALCTGREDEQSRGTQLLRDIRDVFDEAGTTEMFSDAIIEELLKKEESPWNEWRQGKPLTKNGLARLLRPFDVRPTGTIRTGDRTGKGYLRASFEDAWSRYLPSQPSQRHKPNNDGGKPPISTVTPTVTQLSQPLDDGQCDGVTDDQPSLSFGAATPDGQDRDDDVEVF